MLSPPRRWRPVVVAALLLICTAWLLVHKDTALIEHNEPAAMAPAPATEALLPAPPAPPAKRPPLMPVNSQEEADERATLRLTKLPDRYPVQSLHGLPPPGPAGAVPRIQRHPAPQESAEARAVRLGRLAAVREAFEHSWKGYKAHAWMADEVMPLTGAPLNDVNKLGGWAATLVDALDTLWIMGLHGEFRMAVAAVAAIDFSQTDGDVVNVFEVTIRYLGGFLGAYELSGRAHPVLLQKAREVGEVLLGAFDTPNRMPLAKWDWRAYARGGQQREASRTMPAAELGTLSLEFSKLTQLTGDGRFYDAASRIADVLQGHQRRTRLPGMWPAVVDAAGPAFDGDATFTLGGLSDSLYEYLPKLWLLLGGGFDQPRHMYRDFLPVAKQHLFRRVLNPGNAPLVFAGQARVVDDPHTGRRVEAVARGEHLTCFVGGMVGLAARAFGEQGNGGDVGLAAELTDACVWFYNATATGLGPEKFFYATCGAPAEDPAGFRCSWHDAKWRAALDRHWQAAAPLPPMGPGGSAIPDDGNLLHDPIARLMAGGRLPPGYVDIDDPKYMLRPEAIESVFVLWRLTGDASWQHKAWRMFQQVARYTGPATGSGAVAAVGVLDTTLAEPPAMDKMESFWMGETLKYFYLVFADWDVVSLDEWVLNTEAHPLRRMGI